MGCPLERLALPSSLRTFIISPCPSVSLLSASNSYERAGTLGFRCVKDLEPASAHTPCSQASGGQKLCGRWSGPPHAFTALPGSEAAAAGSAGGGGSEWARWYVDSSGTPRTATSQDGVSAIGALRPLCTGTSAAITAGVSYTGIRNASFNPSAAIGSKCGFEVTVTVRKGLNAFSRWLHLRHFILKTPNICHDRLARDKHGKWTVRY